MTTTALKEIATDKLEKQELLDLYRMMLLMRRFEESTYRKYREGKIGGYLHRYDGEEALVAGIIPLLRKDDYILATYRDHGHAIACGADPRSLMAELLGRADGCAGGKGGSMHMISPENGFLGGDGIVGGPVPIALGVGYSIKYRGGDQICACYFGDGALNQGGVHEAMNMAALYGVPVLFVLENNKYAMGTSVERSTAQTDLLAKAKAHGIQGEKLDGMNAIEVRKAAHRIIKTMRETGKPYFVEMLCYRYQGHGVADNPGQQKFYRNEEEIEKYKQLDPILTLRNTLFSQNMMNEADEELMEAELRQLVEDCITYAEHSPEPPMESLFENVFSEGSG